MHTWDYQIMFAFFSYGLFSVVPKDNLVKNIGFNRPDATHTSGPTNWERLPLEQSVFPLKHPIKLTENFKYDKLRQNYVAPSVRRRALQKLKGLLRSVHVKKWRWKEPYTLLCICNYRVQPSFKHNLDSKHNAVAFRIPVLLDAIQPMNDNYEPRKAHYYISLLSDYERSESMVDGKSEKS